MSEHSDSLAAAIAAIWERNRPVVDERLACIRAAADVVATASPDVAVLDAGRSAAHMLAGSLGSFGYPRGSELAREAELMLAAPDPDGVRLSQIADEIERELG